MVQCINATYTGPNGAFTAHKSVSSGLGWITSNGAYIGGYTSFADAIEFARYFANRDDSAQSFNAYYASRSICGADARNGSN